MRLPDRIVGLAGGLVALAVTPLLVVAHSSAAAQPPDAASAELVSVAPAAAAVPAVHVLPPRDARIEIRAPEPTPTPTPPPPPPPTPAPTVAPAVVAAPAPAPPAGSIEAIITAAANRHGVSPAWMLKIARCESSLNPRAYNPAGPYIGLFQFLPSTFRANGGTDIYDPVQQSEITATMLAKGQARAWGCA